MINTLRLDSPFGYPSSCRNATFRNDDGENISRWLECDTNSWCTAEAWLSSFGETAVILWVIIMGAFFAYDIGRSAPDLAWDRKFLIISHAAVWSLALLLAILPARFYGVVILRRDLFYCWIAIYNAAESNYTEPSVAAINWQNWQFGYPLGISFLVSCVMCVKILLVLRRFASHATKSVYMKVLLQYLVLAIVFGPVFVSYLTDIFDVTVDLSPVYTFSNICWKLSGVLLSGLSLSNAQIQQVIREHFATTAKSDRDLSLQATRTEEDEDFDINANSLHQRLVMGADDPESLYEADPFTSRTGSLRDIY